MSQVLSFIVPAYNEEKTIGKLLPMVCRVKLPYHITKEIIVIDDGSIDETAKIALQLSSQFKFIRFIKNKKNLGKTQTVKKGLFESTGDFVIIQDSDLEYNPEDIGNMLKLMIEHDLDVVYGNRFGKKNKVIYRIYYLGNRVLSIISNIFTYFRIRKFLPDIEVGYKLFRGDVIRKIGKTIKSQSNFGFEPEITAKMSRFIKNGKHLQVGVIPIDYYPRSIAEGKKMKVLQDGLMALIEIIKFNLS